MALVATGIPSLALSRGDPVATNVILQNPEAFYGKLITVSAGVEERLSMTAFVVDQPKPSASRR